jgi:hypothetical protein
LPDWSCGHQVLSTGQDDSRPAAARRCHPASAKGALSLGGDGGRRESGRRRH